MTVNMLTSKDRVLTAVRYQSTDRIPRGELLVEEAFLDRLYPDMADASYTEKMKRLVLDNCFDLVTVRVDSEATDGGLGELSKWAAETPCFVMALVDGLFWKPEDPVSFEKFMLGIGKGEGQICDLIRIKKNRAVSLVKRCLDEGADGVIIGDDLAYDGGPFISPVDLEKRIFPGLRKIVDIITMRNRLAFLHSCGNLTRIVDLILSAGFNGLHGLSTFSGNDPLVIRQHTFKRLAFMGIFEVDRLKPHEIEEMKREILGPLSEAGGYILGSAGGLSIQTPLDSFRALYL